MSQMHKIRFSASVRPSVRLLDGVWHLANCECLNDLLDGDLCNNFFYFHIFLPFLDFKHDFIRIASNTASNESQIRSHIEYLIHTCYILVLILLSKLMKIIALMVGFNTI